MGFEQSDLNGFVRMQNRLFFIAGDQNDEFLPT